MRRQESRNVVGGKYSKRYRPDDAAPTTYGFNAKETYCRWFSWEFWENPSWHGHCQYQERKLEFIHLSTQENERMSKQVITAGGEQHLVREDTAKSFRGTYWALISVAAFIIIAAILFFGGFLTSLTGEKVDSPAQIERQAGR